MSVLHDQAFGAKTPTYATVLQLDRKLRAFPVPPVLQVAGFGSSEPRPGGFPETIMLTLQRHIVLAIREMSALISSLNPSLNLQKILSMTDWDCFRSVVPSSQLLRPSYQRPP